jgi:hypothetical protein
MAVMVATVAWVGLVVMVDKAEMARVSQCLLPLRRAGMGGMAIMAGPVATVAWVGLVVLAATAETAEMVGLFCSMCRLR